MLENLTVKITELKEVLGVFSLLLFSAAYTGPPLIVPETPLL
jgi:hypothetical protein